MIAAAPIQAPPAFLVARATAEAQAAGDPSPSAAVWARRPNESYVVVLRGRFVGWFSHPSGTHMARGTRLTIFVSGATGKTTDLALTRSRWIDVPGARDLLPYLRGRALPGCSPSDLVAAAALQGATGNRVGELTVRNASSLACRLPRLPRVRLSWHRRLLRTTVVPYPDPGGGPVESLAPGRAARVYLAWSNWCGVPSSRQIGRPTVELALPLGVLRARIAEPSGGARCDAPSRPSRLAVSGFRTPS